MTTDLPSPASAPSPAAAPHVCGCSGRADEALPEIDARSLPHALRHGAIIGAFTSLAPGAAMVLVAPHDPAPLLAQLRERAEGLQVEYLERGPEAWRLQLTR